MGPGDLVEIIDHGGYYTSGPPQIGMIVGPIPSWSTTRFPALVDGEILYVAIHELRPLVTPDDGGFDNTKENK